MCFTIDVLVSVTDGPDIHPAANTAVVSSAPASKPNYSTWSVKEVDKFFTDAGLNKYEHNLYWLYFSHRGICNIYFKTKFPLIASL